MEQTADTTASAAPVAIPAAEHPNLLRSIAGRIEAFAHKAMADLSTEEHELLAKAHAELEVVVASIKSKL